MSVMYTAYSTLFEQVEASQTQICSAHDSLWHSRDEVIEELVLLFGMNVLA